MPSGTVPGDQSQPYTWGSIDDFSPGIIDYSVIAAQTPFVPAPLGAADPENTYACMALPQGGLGPMPGRINTYAYAPSFPGTVTNLFVTMMTVNPSLDSGQDEVIIGMEGDDGTNHFTIIYSYLLPSSVSHALRNVSDTTTPGIFGAPYPMWSRIIDASDSPLTTPGAPILAFPGSVLTDSNGHNGHLWVYPSDGSNHVYPWGGTPTSPGTPTFSLADLNSTKASVTGQLYAYQNRLVVLSGRSYPWPTSTYDNNEQINFTDPPNSNTLGFQQTILGPEEPFGYGASGSMSSGELFLVKKHGGALSLIGDIFSPSQVTPYPGVQSTGNFYGRATAIPQGLVYCSQNSGAYIWNGGNTASKLSNQLDNDFFDCTSSQIPSSNYGFFCHWWNDLVLFSNNYVYSPLNGAWWKLSNPNTLDTTYFHYATGANAQTLYASPIYIQSGNPHWVSVFDSTVPAVNWSWQSLPIPLQTDQLSDVRQLVVTASCPTNNGTVSVTLTSRTPAGTVTAGPYTTPTLITMPRTYRFNTALLGADQLTLTITGNNTGTNSAPILYSVGFAHQPTTHLPTNN